LHELGTFDDLAQDGVVSAGSAALFRSEAADVWEDFRAPFDAHLRALYVALKKEQVPLDVVVEGDKLDGYQALYLTDAHVSVAASRAIAAWVQGGGQLVAMAGAGMFDELDRPNRVLRGLLGVDPSALELDPEPIRLEKQDLPFARVMDTVHLQGGGTVPVLSAKSRFTAPAATVVARFDDGAPAATWRVAGRGVARYLGFLPGFAFFKPAIPMRPMDRVSDDDAMCHLMPVDFDPFAAESFRVANLRRVVVTSSPSVEGALLTSPRGMLLPLINWDTRPARGLTVTFTGPSCASCAGGRWTDVTRASGKPVQVRATPDGMILELDLDVADAIIFAGSPGNIFGARGP
jgi:Beta-galactosidase trimerisation domain